MTQTMAPITRSVFVRCPPQRAFTLFVQQIGAWWPLDSHTAFTGERSTVSFEDGLLVERSSNGRSDTWGEVLTHEAPSELSFTWHPGRPQGPNTIVLVTFAAEDDGTRVDLEHLGWEAFGDDAEQSRSGYAADDGWSNVIGRFVASVNQDS